MNVEQLGQQIKAKYPAYASKSDADVGNSVIKKYPQYQSMITHDTNGTPVPQPEPGLLSRVGSDISNRFKSAEQTASDVLAGKANIMEGLIQTGGAVAGAALDTVGEVAKSAYKTFVPQQAQDTVQKHVSDVLQTPLGQAGIQALKAGTDAYGIFKQANPQIAKDLESVVNISAFIPVGAATKAVAWEAGSLVGDVGRITGATQAAKETLTGTLQENVGKAVGMTGKMGVTGATEAIPRATNALRTIAENAPNIIVKDLDGVEKVFDPAKASFGETLQALKQTKDSLYSQWTNLAKSAGEKGAAFTSDDFQQLVGALNSHMKDATGTFASKAQSLISDLERNFGTVTDKGVEYQTTDLGRIQSFLEKVNIDVNPLSDKAGAEVSGSLSREIRGILDKKIESGTGAGYQELRSKYADLKTVENGLINQFKKSSRNVGKGVASWVEGFGTLDTIVGLITASPTEALRGAGQILFGKIMKYTRDPETSLQRAFKEIVTPTTNEVQSMTGKAIKSGLEKVKGLPASMSLKDVSGEVAGGKAGYASTLTTEAKKYSTPEEFVKAQPTVYHGTSGENAIKINTEGFKTGSGKGVSGQTSNDFVYATENKVSAGKYVSDRLGIKNPTTVSGSFNGKVLDISGNKMADFEAFGEASKKLGVPLEIGSQGKPTMLNMPAIKKAMQEQGYGAIRFSDRYANGSKALAILPDQIKTKSQLNDIWKEAHSPAQTGKKAKSIGKTK